MTKDKFRDLVARDRRRAEEVYFMALWDLAGGDRRAMARALADRVDAGTLPAIDLGDDEDLVDLYAAVDAQLEGEDEDEDDASADDESDD